MFLALFTFFSMAVFVQGRTECHPDLGCFTDDYPYRSLTRPLSLFPQSPEEINTQLLLITRKNIDQYEVIRPRDLSSIQQSHFNGSRKSVFIIHGYRDKGDAPWVVDMCKAILTKEDANCFCVDWSGGSTGNYFLTLNNLQVVGAEVAYFIKAIVDKYNCSLSKIWLIGHSLGAHACGEVGKRVKGIFKIISLDAAGPGFKGESPEVRIDPTDAVFVLAFHTDSGKFGMSQLVGHYDVFPNGGKDMPGCEDIKLLDVDGLLALPTLSGDTYDAITCDHLYAYRMFTDTILNPEGFMGYCASDYNSFQEGNGFPCSDHSCSLMGYDTEPGDESSCRVYYLNTGPQPNYGRWRYSMAVQTGGNANTYGSITITLFNSDSSDEHEIHNGILFGGSQYTAFIDCPFPPPIVRVAFTWKNTVPLFRMTLWAESVTLIYGNNGDVHDFCSDETTRGDSPQTLTPCP